jgi:hypothetical protein
MLAIEVHPPSVASAKNNGRGNVAAHVVFDVLVSPYTKNVFLGNVFAGWSRLISRIVRILTGC